MSTHVTTEVALVYRAAGRRWFTRKAAMRNAAWAIIKTRCDCQPPASLDPMDSGVACKYHDDSSRYGQRVAARLVRRMEREWRKEQSE